MNLELLPALIDRDRGAVFARSERTDGRHTVLVMGHEYRVPVQQQNLFRQLETVLQHFPGTPVLVEGATGELPCATLPGWEAARRLARPGVQLTEVLGALPDATPLAGIDDVGLLRDQRSALDEFDATVRSSSLARVTPTPSATVLRDALARHLVPIMGRLEDQLAGPGLSRLVTLRRAHLRMPDLVAIACSLAELASARGVDLESFPSVRALAAARRTEQHLDFDAAEHDRQQLAARLAALAEEPPGPGQEAVVGRWLAAASRAERTLAALDAGFSARGTPDWMQHLMVLSKGYAQGKVRATRYHHRLRTLLTALGEPSEPSPSLARYADYLERLDELDCNALVGEELPTLHDRLAAALAITEPERQVVDLRRRLAVLQRLVQLQLPAVEVSRLAGGAPSASNLVRDMLALADERAAPPPERSSAVALAAFMDSLMPTVLAFYRAARARSEGIFANALAAVAAGPPFAILVAGRFHLHRGLEILRTRRDLSWAAFGAAGRGRADRVLARTWAWAFVGIEWSLADGLPGERLGDHPLSPGVL